MRGGPSRAHSWSACWSCRNQYIDYVALGDSEGLLAAATLLAILRHLDGARRQALFWASLPR